MSVEPEVQPSPPEIGVARDQIERNAPGQGCARRVAAPEEQPGSVREAPDDLV